MLSSKIIANYDTNCACFFVVGLYRFDLGKALVQLLIMLKMMIFLG
jgi:hypothetical protein